MIKNIVRVLQEQKDEEGLQKKIIGKIFEGIKVYYVNGERIRDNFDIEFIGGGHSRVYDFIPENEIWIEHLQNADDDADNLVHEVVEILLMKYAGDKYEKAHVKASSIERLIRRMSRKKEGSKEE